jgi:hypothetical protein
LLPPRAGEADITPVVTLTKVRVYGRKRLANSHDCSPSKRGAGDAHILLRWRSWILTFVRMTAV